MKKAFVTGLQINLILDHQNLLNIITSWKENQYRDRRGRIGLSQEDSQLVYDCWIQNSICSTHGRNGRNMVTISKVKYYEQFGKIINKNIVVKEKKKTREGRISYSSNRRIVTCTI